LQFFDTFISQMGRVVTEFSNHLPLNLCAVLHVYVRSLINECPLIQQDLYHYVLLLIEGYNLVLIFGMKKLIDFHKFLGIFNLCQYPFLISELVRQLNKLLLIWYRLIKAIGQEMILIFLVFYFFSVIVENTAIYKI
jgi:hypothetical protein